MKKTDRAWLAGFYEGEGSISRNKSRKNRQLRIEIAQAGDDCPEPLIRCQQITGVGKIYGPYTHSNRNLVKTDTVFKPRWSWHVQGIRDVSYLVGIMRPWLSPRRLTQIKAALDGWAEYQEELGLRGTRRPPPPLVLELVDQEPVQRLDLSDG